MTGNTNVSFSEFEDCSIKTTNDCSISTKCCSFHEMSFDLDYETISSFISFKIFQPSLITKCISSILLKPVYTKADFNFFTNLPPPSGFDLLKIVQVFRL